MNRFSCYLYLIYYLICEQDGFVFLELELELELYFYLNKVNLSDKIIIIIKITIYFNLYKHDPKI